MPRYDLFFSKIIPDLGLFFFFGILAAFALNSSNSLIHTRNALEIKPTKVISVYSCRSEIIHVLLALVRSWGKLFAHTH